MENTSCSSSISETQSDVTTHRELTGSSLEDFNGQMSDSSTATTNLVVGDTPTNLENELNNSCYVTKTRFSKLKSGVVLSKEALEETLNRLTGLGQNNVKPKSKLRAASFVLAYTIHDIVGNASRIAEDEGFISESHFVIILNKLQVISTELQHLLSDAKDFLQSSQKVSQFCNRYLSRRQEQKPPWYSVLRVNSNISSAVTTVENGPIPSEENPETLWLLFVQNGKENKNNSFCTFSQINSALKIDFLECLIERYRRLVATAHTYLKNAQLIFRTQINSEDFFNSSFHRFCDEEFYCENLAVDRCYREFIQKILPITRSIISLNTSVLEVTDSANNIISLTQKFLFKMKSNLFSRNCFSILGNQITNIFSSPASIVWGKIEIRLQDFVSLLAVDTMAVLMENGSLLLRKHRVTLPCVELEENNKQDLLNDVNPALNENGENLSEDEITLMDDFLQLNELEPPILSDPLASIGRELFDLEVNMSEMTREDIENNNVSGPMLIYVDYSECPPEPEPEPDSSDNSSISNSSSIHLEPEPDPNTTQYPPMFLTYHTINFLLLLYNWFARFYPQRLHKIDEKVKPNIVHVDTDELPMKIMITTKTEQKERKSVRLTVPEQKLPSPSDTEIAARTAAYSRRKSSIPFADRTPKVRFNRIETTITSTKPGPHKPVVPGTESEEDILKRIHSILKENDHPILIDLTLLTFQGPTGNTLSNNEMLLCIAMVEWLCKTISRADHRGRGAMDILSFPTAGERVENESRIRASLTMTLDLMQRMWTEINLNDPELHILLAQLSENMRSYVKCVVDIVVTSKQFLYDSDGIYQKWRGLLKKKGEFHLEQEKMKNSIYKHSMPENVLLYEDDTTSPTTANEGTLTFFWNSETMTLSSDLEKKTRKVHEFSVKERLEVLNIIICHCQDLISCANKQLALATEVFQEPILDTGFENIRTRVIGMKFDEKFDPLCALDLKNTLSELVGRNCELLNCAEEIYESLVVHLKIVKLLDKLTKQFLEDREKKDKKCVACYCKLVRYEDICNLLGRMPTSDTISSMPIPTTFEMPNTEGYMVLGEEETEEDDTGKGDLPSRTIS